MTIQPLPFANPIRVNERGIERTLCIIITADGRVTEWLTDDEIAALQES